MKFYLFVIVFVFVLSNFPSMGQIDTLYIEKIPDVKILAPHTTLRKFQIAFSTAVSEKVVFQNYNLGVGIRFKRKKLGVSLSVPLLAFNQSDFGKPKAYGFNFNIYPSSYYLQGTVRYLSGFDNLNALQNNEPVFRPNDRMLYVNTTAHYAFNHRRYSLRSAFKMINKQKRSVGSWIVAIPISYQYFTSDSLRLPLKDKPDFKLDLYRSFKLGLSGGYAYSKVIGNWSANGLVTGGAEFRTLKYRNLSTRNLRNQFLVSPRLQLTASVVYNTRAFFAGLVGRYLPGLDTADGLNTRVQQWSVRLMIGKRL